MMEEVYQEMAEEHGSQGEEKNRLQWHEMAGRERSRVILLP